MDERPPKILVVDDVPENVRLLEAVLTARGYRVLTARDGIEALTVVEAEEPDLLLLDVMMPGLDGYAVCRRLRENDDTAVLPVIMVTSSLGESPSGRSAGTTSISAPGSRSAMPRAARSASKTAPTTPRSARSRTSPRDSPTRRRAGRS